MEPEGVLRVMSDQYTPDERFGGSAAHCALSTPRDATATHILVFPTSATAQVGSIRAPLTWEDSLSYRI
jgi:mediator of RNA polymerase II transcription subunit 13